MWCEGSNRNRSRSRDSEMIQVFQYPHETLMQVSTEWKTEDSIQGYNDIEKFENDYIKLMLVGS